MHRTKPPLEVTGTVDDTLGLSAYMNIDALHRLLREDRTISGAALLIDRAAEPELHRRAAVGRGRHLQAAAQIERPRHQHQRSLCSREPYRGDAEREHDPAWRGLSRFGRHGVKRSARDRGGIRDTIPW